MDIFEALQREADRQERQTEMARLIFDLAEDHSVAEIVAECVSRYGARDLADVIADMTDMARRNGEGADALDVLTRTIN